MIIRNLIASILALLTISIPMAMGDLPPKEQSMAAGLAERFMDPPAESRILKIIHSWPDQPSAQDQLIQTLQAQGFGGIVSNVSFDEYMRSEEKWQAFVRAIHTAKDAGMALWLYDERGYPSGVAGGLVLEDHPELEAQGLLVATATTEGERVVLELPPGELLLAQAVPEKDGVAWVDGALGLSDAVTDGKLTWEPPTGTWQVLAITQSRLYDGTHAQLSLADKLPYINLLQPEATRRFLDVNHEQYAERLGTDLGEWFVAMFTDEPSLMSMFLRPMPYRVLPWSPELADVFQERCGYPLQPQLAGLVLDTPNAKRVRYDFWQTVGELVAESFFGQIQDWCREHGLPSGGHLLMEESLTSHVPLYGDFFQCVRRLDAPSIDCLTSIPQQVPWFVARMISSAAALEGNEITMCETSDHSQVYRPAGDERPRRIVTEAEIRGTCNRLMLGGITTITSYYSFAELTNEQLQRLNDWVGRCSTMLQGGYPVTDIAMLYPAESLWTRFVPSYQWANGATRAVQVEQAFRAASDGLYGAGKDFLYIDSQAIQQATVEDGVLVHGKLRWRVVVLPCVDTLPRAAWEKLTQFWREGGIVVALSTLPQNSEAAFPSDQVQELAQEMFGSSASLSVHASPNSGAGVFLPTGSEGLLPQVLGGLVEAEVSVDDTNSPIRTTHRHRDGDDIFFLINDSPEDWSGSVSLPVAGVGEQWNPATGEVTPVLSGRAIPLSLEDYGGVLLRFADSHRPKRFAVTEDELPGLVLAPLPFTEPTAGHGEFVQSELSTDSTHEQPNLPAWRSVGELTKGEVNTHLFLSFRYPDLLDLSGVQNLVFDTWVPDGQHTPTQLLVILRDRDDADYLATTSRPLGEAGHVRTFLPLSQFQLAGWSDDANDRLDLEHVFAISVGWGGYFGTEGETVEFSMALPQISEIH